MSDPQNIPNKETSQLATLLTYLQTDPDNEILLLDTAEAALEDGQTELTLELLDRCSALGTPTLYERNLKGLTLMKAQKYPEAIEVFIQLLNEQPEDSALHFNLAWVHAMVKQFDESLKYLNQTTTTELGQAAMLKVQILHDLGALEDATNAAENFITLHPEHNGLLAAISVLAMDTENPELAKTCALKAGSHPDALTTLGTLALEENISDANRLFEAALQINKHNPRAWIGKGLTDISTQNYESGAKHLDHGAAMFDTHIGSWIAAGWAHIMRGSVSAGYERFQRALQIDPNFAESQGSLAVVHVLKGEREEAKIKIKTALKLDKACLTAALAQTLLLSQDGQEETARKIFDQALNTPIDEDGKTIAQLLTRLST